MKKMGKHVLLMMAVMIVMVMLPMGAMSEVSGSMTASDFISEAINGVITLTGDVTITDGLAFSSDMKINLAGKTLTLKSPSNWITKNNNITFENGKIVANDLTTSGDGGIIKIGDRSGSKGKLTLDKVAFSANNVFSNCGVFLLYGENTLDIKNGSSISVTNEKDTNNGNVFYSNAGKQGKINITDSTITATNGNSGFYGGTIEINNSTIDFDLKKHGMNGGAGYLDVVINNSNVEMEVGKRGITIYPGNTVEMTGKSKVHVSSSGTGAIVYYNGATQGVSVGNNSSLNLGTKNQLVVDENVINGENYSKYIDFGDNVITIIGGEVYIGDEIPAVSENVQSLPQTGDNSNILFFVALLAFCGAGLTMLKKRSMGR